MSPPEARLFEEYSEAIREPIARIIEQEVRLMEMWDSFPGPIGMTREECFELLSPLKNPEDWFAKRKRDFEQVRPGEIFGLYLVPEVDRGQTVDVAPATPPATETRSYVWHEVTKQGEVRKVKQEAIGLWPSDVRPDVAYLYQELMLEHCCTPAEALAQLRRKYRLPAAPGSGVAALPGPDDLMLLVVRMATAAGEPGFGAPPPMPEPGEGLAEYRKRLESKPAPKRKAGRPSERRRILEIAAQVEARKATGASTAEAAAEVASQYGLTAGTVKKIYASRNTELWEQDKHSIDEGETHSPLGRELGKSSNYQHRITYLESSPVTSGAEREFLRLIDRSKPSIIYQSPLPKPGRNS